MQEMLQGNSNKNRIQEIHLIKMMNDTLSNALSKIMNAEKSGKNSCEVRPISKTIKQVLTLMKENGYLGDVEEKTDTRGSGLNVNLIGAINKCGPIKPRFPVKKDVFEGFEKRYLPAKDFGVIIVSTPKGFMTHIDAKKKGMGGRLVAYCY